MVKDGPCTKTYTTSKLFFVIICMILPFIFRRWKGCCEIRQTNALLAQLEITSTIGKLSSMERMGHHMRYNFITLKYGVLNFKKCIKVITVLLYCSNNVYLSNLSAFQRRPFTFAFLMFFWVFVSNICYGQSWACLFVKSELCRSNLSQIEQ